jgi:hypothetical protein
VAATLEQRRKQRFEFLRCLYKMSHGSERVLFYIEEVGDAAALGELEALAAAQSLAERRLIRVVMGHIISISQAGADELEAALEQPDQPTMHLPPPQTVASRPVAAPLTPIEDGTEIREEWVREEPIREESIEPVPGGHILEDESDEFAGAELKRICEAIGLDPKALSGDLASHHRHASPESFHERDPDQIEEPATNGHSEHDARNVSAAANNDSPKPRTDNGPPFSFREADLDVILESQRQQLPKLGLAYDELAEAQSEIDTARAQLASPKPKRPILAASLRTLLSILENAAPPLTSDTWENVVAIRDFQERLSA